MKRITTILGIVSLLILGIGFSNLLAEENFKYLIKDKTVGSVETISVSIDKNRGKIENDILKVDVNGGEGTIQVFDKRTKKLWKGNSLLKAVYWDGFDRSVNTTFTKDAGWQIIFQEKKDKIGINYSHIELELFLSLEIELKDDKIKLTLPASKIKEGESINSAKGNPNKFSKVDLLAQFGSVREGNKGYLVLPLSPGVLCEFKDKISSEYEIGIYSSSWEDSSSWGGCSMPIFGFKNDNSSFLGIIEGGKYDAALRLGTNQGEERIYYIHPSFSLRYHYNEEKLAEDISVEYHFLPSEESSYTGMAKRYRKYVLEDGKVKPLRERIEDNPTLNYAAKCLEVRIRLGWKPVPPDILEQTPENEPQMHVACTFDKVGEIIEEFKRHGIDKAEFCLVGWNVGGHDGRYPQIFPVEEKLGGEEKLRKLIKKAQDMGYQIVAHDDYVGAYRISEDWSEEYIVKKYDGNLFKSGQWGGGQAYRMCAKSAYELFATRDLPRIRKLGFKGLHFSDVLSIIGPEINYDPNHPETNRECIEWRNKTLELAQRLFGGAHSEGSLDFAAGSIDRVLYVSFPEENLKKRNYVDRVIPLWEIVYHGILLYNVSTDTVNSILKEKKHQLRVVEYGGSPQIYFYSRFVSTPRGNWMGEEDFSYENKESLKKDIARIKKLYDEYEKLSYLQTEFIENHQMLADDVYKTVYSNGDYVIVNYSDKPYKVKERTIHAYSYLLCQVTQ